mgnify:CR=1 FL=1
MIGLVARLDDERWNAVDDVACDTSKLVISHASLSHACSVSVLTVVTG